MKVYFSPLVAMGQPFRIKDSSFCDQDVIRVNKKGY